MASTKNISVMEFERIRRTPSRTHDSNYPITEKPAIDLCLEANDKLPKEYKDFLRQVNNGFSKRLKEKGLS